MSFHSLETGASVHVINAFTYADQAARESAVLSATDVGKAAIQSDDSSFWILTNHSPMTWRAATGNISPELLETTITDLVNIDITLEDNALEDSIDVYWIALKITPSTEYSLAGNTLTISPNPEFKIGDTLTIKYYRLV